MFQERISRVSSGNATPSGFAMIRLHRQLLLVPLLGLLAVLGASRGSFLASQPEDVAAGRVFYVRQTVGDDSNDGLSPQTAWRRVSKLTAAMHAGDTVYVGPGLYREGIAVMHEGTAERPIVFIADTTGRVTGDPPGPVLLSGAEPFDEQLFEPHSAPGVYRCSFPDYIVLGAVEMDGTQQRYHGVLEPVQEVPYLDRVAKIPGSVYYDSDSGILYIHTSDGKPPATHEIEVMRRGSGILVVGKPYVRVVGFTFRHFGDSGITFSRGADHGMALDNTSYGNRQGIRVRASANVIIADNVLFRNQNAGIYFLQESVHALATGTIAYENVKGIRWGSQSNFGSAIGNALFDNEEAGMSIEDVSSMVLRGNRLGNNSEYQLLVLKSQYDSEDNCFERTAPDQQIAELFHGHGFETLADYQKELVQDFGSREGACGPWPRKVDVVELHTKTTTYGQPEAVEPQGAKQPLAPGADPGIQ